MCRYYETTIAENIYNKLFDNSNFETINFVNEFPGAGINYEFAYIKLNDEFIIKIERA